MLVLKACWRSSKEVPMAIIGGLDVHRSQITYDWVDPDTGQHQRGRLAPAHREHLRGWLEQFQGRPAAFAVEGCTGWRYVVEELQRAGIAAHLAEPADTSAARGPKRRAKTDQLDACHLRELLAAGRLPESWIPPTHVLEARTQIRCYKALTDEHTAWLQRVHATLFQHGVPAEPNLLAADRKTRTTAVTGSCRRRRVGGDHPLPVGSGVLQGLLGRSGHRASRSEGRGVGHNPPQEALEAFAEAEAVVEVDGC
jgi:Transposase